MDTPKISHSHETHRHCHILHMNTFPWQWPWYGNGCSLFSGRWLAEGVWCSVRNGEHKKDGPRCKSILWPLGCWRCSHLLTSVQRGTLRDRRCCLYGDPEHKCYNHTFNNCSTLLLRCHAHYTTCVQELQITLARSTVSTAVIMVILGIS